MEVIGIIYATYLFICNFSQQECQVSRSTNLTF